MKLRSLSPLAAVAVAMALFASPLSSCTAYISCSYQGGPCSGTLDIGWSIDLRGFSWGGNMLNFYLPPQMPCASFCTYNMQGGGESWSMSIWNWDCDDDGFFYAIQWGSGSKNPSGGTPEVPPGG